MKRSELKEYIKETILNKLDEAEGSIITDDPNQAEKLADKGKDVSIIRQTPLAEKSSKKKG